MFVGEKDIKDCKSVVWEELLGGERLEKAKKLAGNIRIFPTVVFAKFPIDIWLSDLAGINVEDKEDVLFRGLQKVLFGIELGTRMVPNEGLREICEERDISVAAIRMAAQRDRLNLVEVINNVRGEVLFSGGVLTDEMKSKIKEVVNFMDFSRVSEKQVVGVAQDMSLVKVDAQSASGRDKLYYAFGEVAVSPN